MKKYPSLSPEDWRNLQLDGLTSSSEIQLLYDYIFTKEASYFKFQIIELLNILKKLGPTREIIVALDEANVLIEKYPNTYDNSKGEKKRSLFRPGNKIKKKNILFYILIKYYSQVVSSFGLFNIHVIIAGTYLSLNDEDSIQSSAMKTSTSNESRKYDKFTTFR